MRTGQAPDLEELLRHADFLRTVARDLIDDPSCADDVAQETLLAAARTRLRDPKSIRVWLKRVAQNFLAQMRRGEQRRARRESLAAAKSSVPATAELVQRVELQRLVATAVLALDEPYRTCVLLRFWEGLPPREIARRLAIPVATVRTRLQRALAALRGQLDRHFGGEHGDWRAVLAPLALGVGGASLATRSVTAAAVLGVAALLIAVGVKTVSTPGAGEASPAISEQSPSAGTSAATSASPGRAALLSEIGPRTTPGHDRGLQGTVVDAVRQPLAGATVQLFASWDDPFLQRPPLATVQTDAAGHYAFTDLADGGYHVVASKDGLTARAWPAITGALDDEGTGMRMQLHDARVLEGIVVDDQHRPIAGAHVLGFSERSGHEFVWPEAVTGDDGRFRLAGLPVSEVFVNAFADGYGCEETGPYDAARREIAIQLAPARTATVRVSTRWQHDATPIAGARVSLFLSREHRGHLRLPESMSRPRTDRDGCASVRGLPPGRYELHVSADGVDFLQNEIEVRLAAGDDPEVVVLAGSPIRMRGTLELEGSGPLPAQRLLFATSPFTTVGVEVVTDADGAFELTTPVAEGHAFWARLQSEDYALLGGDLRLASLRGVAAADGVLALRAVKGARVSGKVLREEGTPARGVQVSLTTLREFRVRDLVGSEPDAIAYQSTDHEGRFDFAGLSTYRNVSIMVSGAGVTAEHPEHIDLLPGATIEDVVITLPRPCIVSGIVRDEHGRALPGVTVGAISELSTLQARSRVVVPCDGTITARDGRFTLDRLPPGGNRIGAGPLWMRRSHLALTGRAEDTATNVQLNAGETRADLEIIVAVDSSKPGEVRGRVTWDNGHAPWRAQVELTRAVDGRSLHWTSFTDEAGRFVVMQLPTASLNLVARVIAADADIGSYTHLTSNAVEIVPGSPAVELVIERRKPGSLRGRVVARDGCTLPDALDGWLEIPEGHDRRTINSTVAPGWNGSGWQVRLVLTDHVFEIPSISPGNYELRLESPQLGHKSLHFAIEAGAQTNLGDITFDAMTAWRGSVLDRQARPIVGAWVGTDFRDSELDQWKGLATTARTRADGTFECARRLDRNDITIYAEGYAPLTIAKAVAAADEAIDVRLLPSASLRIVNLPPAARDAGWRAQLECLESAEWLGAYADQTQWCYSIGTDDEFKDQVAGRYLIHLWQAATSVSSQHPDNPTPGTYLRVTVDLTPGETTTLDVAAHWR